MYAIIYDDVKNRWPNEDGTIHFSMLSLCNRSIAFHMIEQILKVQEHSQHEQQNIVNIDKIIFISDDNPYVLRSYLGNGDRWGCTIEVLPLQGSLDDTIDIVAYSNNLDNPKNILIFTKLCIFNPQEIYNSINYFLQYTQGNCYKIEKTNEIHQNTFFISKELTFSPLHIPYLEIKNLEDITIATNNALKGKYPWLLREEKQCDKLFAPKALQSLPDMTDIFIGVQCSIAPSARVYSPSIIGNNVHIGENCTIGPYSCIGDFCIVDENVIIENSILFKHTYISPLVSIKNAYVIGRNITQIGSDVCIIAPSALIEKNKSDEISLLSWYHDKKLYFLKRVLCASIVWIAIFFVFLCISPIILLQWILGKGSFARIRYTENDKVETLECIPISKKIQNTIYVAKKTIPSWLQGPIITFFPSILNVILREIPLFGSSFIDQSCRQAKQWLKAKSPNISYSKRKGLLPAWIGLGKAPMTSVEKYIHAIWYAQVSNACVDCKMLLGILRYGYGHIKELRKNNL